MGCCFSSKAGKGGGDVELEQRSDATRCKVGKMGSGVQVGPPPTTISGTGVVLGTCAIDQDSAYWEVKVLTPGGIRIGVARDLNEAMLTQPLGGSAEDAKSWALDGDKDNEDMFTACPLTTDDIVTVCFDQASLPMLTFSKNGQPLGEIGAVNRIRGGVFPAISVADGASVELRFDESAMAHPPPSSRFSPLICATALI